MVNDKFSLNDIEEHYNNLMSKLSIRGQSIKSIQYPTAQNGYCCNVIVEIVTPYAASSMYGIAHGSENSDPEKMVEIAIKRASIKAMATCLDIQERSNKGQNTSYNNVQNSPSGGQYSSYNNAQNSPAPNYTNKSLNELNGGGNKRISDPQKNSIIQRCINNNLSPENFVYERYGKNINELNGSQANQLIRELMSFNQKR